MDLLGDPGAGPGLDPAADRGVRATGGSDTFEARAVNEGVYQVFEHHPVRDTAPLTAQRMPGMELAALRQQRGELDWPDFSGIDDSLPQVASRNV